VTIALVDTSVYCNILDIPGFAQNRDDVVARLRLYIAEPATLFLPIATIIETGNHIAHIRDGRLRRSSARRFAVQVCQALDGIAPWTVPQPLLDPTNLRGYLDEFPDSAMRGLGLADLSIIKEFERQCELTHDTRRVFIWSLDDHLRAYDFRPQQSGTLE